MNLADGLVPFKGQGLNAEKFVNPLWAVGAPCYPLQVPQRLSSAEFQRSAPHKVHIASAGDVLVETGHHIDETHAQSCAGIREV